MTRAQYARYSGLCKSCVSRLVQAGTISLNQDGRLDPVVADQECRLRVRPRMPGLTKDHLARPTPRPPWDRVDQQVAGLVAALEAKLRHLTRYVFVHRLDESQLRTLLCLVGEDVLEQWQKTGTVQKGTDES
jgi:hypothetical protein